MGKEAKFVVRLTINDRLLLNGLVAQLEQRSRSRCELECS